MVVLLYIPFPDREIALSVCRKVVSEKLAACGNLLGPMTSVYEWQEKMCEETEFSLILKTHPERVEALRKRVAELHPYDCPCIAEWKAEVNADFGDWVKDQTG
jgi:periplasmic divalent cation tolerance protein